MDKSELNQIAELLEQAPERITEFKKETYEESFRKYVDNHAHIWSMLAETWNENEPNSAQNRLQVADCLAKRARDKIDAVNGRAKKYDVQLNINLYMVSYLLPAIISYQRRCGGREDER